MLSLTLLLYCPCLCCHSLTLLLYCPCLCCHSLTLLLYCPCLCCHFCNSMWSFWVEANLWKKNYGIPFFIVCLYMYWRFRSNYQMGRVEIPLTSLTPPHFCACPKTGPRFPMSHVVVSLCSVSSDKMRRDYLFCWYSGGMDDHLHLNFLFMIAVCLFVKLLTFQES